MSGRIEKSRTRGFDAHLNFIWWEVPLDRTTRIPVMIYRGKALCWYFWYGWRQFETFKHHKRSFIIFSFLANHSQLKKKKKKDNLVIWKSGCTYVCLTPARIGLLHPSTQPFVWFWFRFKILKNGDFFGNLIFVTFGSLEGRLWRKAAKAVTWDL